MQDPVVPAGGIRISLKTKIAVILSAIIVVIMIVLSTISLTREINLIENEATQRMIKIATIIGTHLIMDDPLRHDQYGEFINKVMRLNFNTDQFKIDIFYISVFDEDDRPLLSRLNRRSIEIAAGGDANRNTDDDLIRTIRGSKLSGAGDIKIVDVDIVSRGRKTGYIELAFSLNILQQQIMYARGIAVGVTIVFIILGVFVSYFFGDQLTRPVNDLVRGLRAVGAGDLNVRLEKTTHDEIGLMADNFNSMIDGLKEREFIKNTFRRYVSKQVAEKILQTRSDEIIKGERRKATIMFTDIRGFTPLSEQMTPEEVVALLNEYFSIMVDCVFKYNGMLDKFIGDCVMAVWGAPMEEPEDALNAIRCAIEMQQRLEEFNRKRVADNQKAIRVGIGINTGSVVAGNIGSIVRMEYTVIGDSVNTAQRIQAHSLTSDILVSESTYLEVRDHIRAEKLARVKLKGKTDEIQIYRVMELLS